ncbi:MAG TPA: hypothetical protein DDZ89_09045 [Clostridiales bacterium]|nr:hypothetical protein [Clostridiales bacterium]
MLVKKIFGYIFSLLKYIIFGAVVVVIVNYFNQKAAIIVGGILLLGVFGAAHNDYKENVLPKIQISQLKKDYKKAEDEFNGFDDMLRTVQRHS